MNRTIKFRGKSTLMNQWVYGSLVITDDNTNQCFRRKPLKDIYQICQYHSGDWDMGGWEFYDIFPKTIGQFTGLPDITNIDIYEGDIIKAGYTCERGEFYHNYEVVYKESDAMFYLSNSSKYWKRLTKEQVKEYSYRVIGNIHDNPNLLKEE